MEKSGQWQRALLLLQHMEASELLPDAVSFNACIGASAKEEQWRCGLQLLDEMLKRLVEPDEITYNCLATGCEREHWQLSLSLLLPRGSGTKL